MKAYQRDERDREEAHYFSEEEVREQLTVSEFLLNLELVKNLKLYYFVDAEAKNQVHLDFCTPNFNQFLNALHTLTC